MRGLVAIRRRTSRWSRSALPRSRTSRRLLLLHCGMVPHEGRADCADRLSRKLVVHCRVVEPSLLRWGPGMNIVGEGLRNLSPRQRHDILARLRETSAVATRPAAPRIAPRVDRLRAPPLSAGQAGLWFLDRIGS